MVSVLFSRSGIIYRTQKRTAQEREQRWDQVMPRTKTQRERGGGTIKGERTRARKQQNEASSQATGDEKRSREGEGEESAKERVCAYLNAQILLGLHDGGVGKGEVANLVEGIGGVGDELAQEDLLVGVEGVDDQAHQLGNLCLEGKGLDFRHGEAVNVCPQRQRHTHKGSGTERVRVRLSGGGGGTKGQQGQERGRGRRASRGRRSRVAYLTRRSKRGKRGKSKRNWGDGRALKWATEPRGALPPQKK
jgi:hypothetical protein